MGGTKNSAFPALIHKERNVVSLRFKPISLYNVLYKIMPKINANILQGVLHKLISPNQGGFVAKRQIWDNIVLVEEAIHSNKDRGENELS